jgi:Domain of unknown function (DUF2703)
MTEALEPSDMKTLPIVWQRLVKAGATCERCGSTHQQILGALARLEPALQPLGIQPVLHTVMLDESTFRADPSASNRIWIAGKQMEDWLGASTGSSPCCSVCGDLPCRTLEVDGHSFEAVPQDLVVKAAMIAAAGMIEAAHPNAEPAACCVNACGTACE